MLKIVDFSINTGSKLIYKKVFEKIHVYFMIYH